MAGLALEWLGMKTAATLSSKASVKRGSIRSSWVRGAVAGPITRPAEAKSGYNQPPKNILDVMQAPSPPVPLVSPTQDAILLLSWQEYPSISRVATPFLRLAGVRVEPKKSQ